MRKEKELKFTPEELDSYSVSVDKSGQITSDLKFTPEELEKYSNTQNFQSPMADFPEKALATLDIVGAPVRAGITDYSKSGDVGSALSAAKDTVMGFPKSVQQAPSGEQMLEQVAPSIANPVTGFVAELVTDPLTVAEGAFRFGGKLIQKGASKIANAAQKKGIRATARQVARLSSASKEGRLGIDSEKVGAQLYAQNLQGILSNPKKAKEILRGGKELSIVNVGGVPVVSKHRTNGGLLGKISEETAGLIKEVSPAYGGVPSKDIADHLGKIYTKRSVNPISGEAVSPEIIKKYSDKAYEILTKSGAVDANLSLDQVHQLRKNLNSQVRSADFYKDASEAVQIENKVKMDIIDTLDDWIVGILDNEVANFGGKQVKLSDVYKAKNSQYSNLAKLDELLEGIDTKTLSKSSLSELISSTAIGGMAGYGVGSMVGYPTHGLAFGAIANSAGSASRVAKEAYPRFMAGSSKAIERGANIVDKYAPKITPMLPQASRMFGEDNMSRDPQSVGTERLQNMRLPRSTEFALSHPNVFLAKIAYSAPQHLDIVEEALSNQDGEALSAILPVIMAEAPAIFERDQYDRLDGVIPKHNRMKAGLDVADKEDLDPIQKAKLRTRINKTGRMD